MDKEKNNQLKTAALHYANHGWKVLPLHHAIKPRLRRKANCSCRQPCGTPGRHPRIEITQASNKLDVVRAWWDRWPKANIGIATGSCSKLVIVKFTTRAAYNGLKTFLPECGWAMLPTSIFRWTSCVYFRAPKGSIITSELLNKVSTIRS